MADETAIVPKSAVELAKEREAYRELRKKKRARRLEEAMLSVQETAASDVALRKYVFLDDKELLAKGLTKQQIAKVRGWEVPKKQAPFSLEASSTFVTSMLRRDNDKGKVTVNVENATIVLPEKKKETAQPVYIDVDPGAK